MEIQGALTGWIPYRLSAVDNEVLCKWLYVNGQPYTDPFFEDTVGKCANYPPNIKRQKSFSDLNMISAWTPQVDLVQPALCILHVSRCGSTLISQALSISAKNIVLSEVPLFDDILRLPFKQPEVTQNKVQELLRAAVQFYSTRRSGIEQHVVIKCESWHLLFYKQIRGLFSLTPFFLLYRHPAGVLFSQQRRKGMHAVKGLIEPELFGFDEEEYRNCSYNDYMALVLEKYYRVILDIAHSDNHFLLVNYNDGIKDTMERISAFTGMNVTEEDKELIQERSRYHAKEPEALFVEQYPDHPVDAPNMRTLLELYAQLEKRRLAIM